MSAIVAMGLSVTAARTGLTVKQLLSDCRGRQIARPRQCLMYAAYRAGKSLPQIGRALGGRDHTSVMHGVRRVERAIREGEAWASLALDLEAALSVDRFAFEADGQGREWLVAA